jgi:low temperature requirement protein LtrA
VKPLVAPLRLRASLGDHARKVTWLELFFDLIFVAAVAQVAEPLREHYTAHEVLRLTVLFVLIWWAWTGHAVFATRFDTDDAGQRLLTLLQMFCVAAMAANAKDALDSRSSAGFAAAYAAVRLVLVAQYYRARRVPHARALATRYFAGHGLAALLWMASALVPAPARFALWTLAFAIDLGTPWFAMRHTVELPPDAAHLPERFGLFMLILLGDSVVAVMQGMESQETWAPTAAISAFVSMAIVFVLWWWYFDGAAGAATQQVRDRRDALRFHIWSYAHFPLFLGVIIGGVGLRRMVTAAARTVVDPAEALMLTGAIGLVMIAMTAIAATSGHNRRHRTRGWVSHLTLAATTIAIGLFAGMSSPVGLVLAVAAVSLAQLALSLSSHRESWRMS